MIKRLLVAGAAIFLAAGATYAAPVTSRENDLLEVQVMLNGSFPAKFFVDSGASLVSMSPTLVNYMISQGSITKADYVEDSSYVTADGAKHASKIFRLHSVQVGDKIAYDVLADVDPDQKGNMMLLGQSFLRKFRSWSIDNERHELVLVSKGELPQAATSMPQVPSAPDLSSSDLYNLWQDDPRTAFGLPHERAPQVPSHDPPQARKPYRGEVVNGMCFTDMPDGLWLNTRTAPPAQLAYFHCKGF